MSTSREAEGAEIERLRARVADLERELAVLNEVRARPAMRGNPDDPLANRIDLLQSVLDSCPVYILAKDLEGRYLLANRLCEQAMKAEVKDLLGKTDYEFFPKETADVFAHYDGRVLCGESTTSEHLVELDGEMRLLVTAKFPVRDDEGKVYATCGVTTDVTTLREAQEENRRLQAEMLRIQAESLQALSTPLLPIAEGVVLMPLLGNIDQGRAQDVLEKLLGGVSSFRASMVILDITGVPVVDTGVAGALLGAVKAVGLLGADVVITGVQPAIAQALVELGIEIEGVIIRNTLRSGIAYALARRPSERARHARRGR